MTKNQARRLIALYDAAASVAYHDGSMDQLKDALRLARSTYWAAEEELEGELLGRYQDADPKGYVPPGFKPVPLDD